MKFSDNFLGVCRLENLDLIKMNFVEIGCGNFNWIEFRSVLTGPSGEIVYEQHQTTALQYHRLA
jgi:hypothetical protein